MMTRNALIVALALSLLFNVFVLLGFVQGREESASPAKTDERVVGDVTRELQLSESQARSFGRMRSEMRQRAMALDEQVALLQHAFASELNQEAPEMERLRSIAAEQAELRRQRRELAAEKFGEFVQDLTPQQREMLSRRFHPASRRGQGGKAGGSASHASRMIERFDANKDGKLDAREFDAARFAMNADRPRDGHRQDERRRPPEHGDRDQMDNELPPFWKRFDVNGDEALDLEELRAIEQAKRPTHGPRQPPPKSSPPI